MITLILIVIIILFIIRQLCSKPQGFPPGPFRWPWIGNLLNTRGRLAHDVAKEMAEVYGEVSGFYLGSQPVVFLSSVETIKDACARDDLSGRPISILRPTNIGIIFNYGLSWREQRRFTLRQLRDLGFGKQSLQNIINEETKSLLKEVARMAGPDWCTPVELYDVLGNSAINVLWHMMSGQRYERQDARFRKLTNLVKVLTSQVSAHGTLINFFPWFARFLPEKISKPNTLIREELGHFIREDIEKHKIHLDPDNPRDFIDGYLNEINKQLQISGNADKSFSEKLLINICVDLFIAGADTTFSALTFALLYVVYHLPVQRKVQEEIDRIVGFDRLPELADRTNLVYTEATLLESLRMNSVAPLALPHAPLAAENDVHFRGFVIPKNARVLMNVAHISKDPTIWGDPENFRPERFLGTNSELLRHSGILIPFGIGKRQCLGETLAKDNLFLFFSAIMQHYSLSVFPGENLPSLDPIGGITLGPKNMRVLVKPRFDTF